ncbi:hypothetical protein B0H13DRAFT_2266796 [Mycena leptocephala]|nr:hypothetical protein B0H13DRAFT_2266796 [Mycena leptocephala]
MADFNLAGMQWMWHAQRMQVPSNLKQRTLHNPVKRVNAGKMRKTKRESKGTGNRSLIRAANQHRHLTRFPSNAIKLPTVLPLVIDALPSGIDACGFPSRIERAPPNNPRTRFWTSTVAGGYPSFQIPNFRDDVLLRPRQNNYSYSYRSTLVIRVASAQGDQRGGGNAAAC